MRSLLHIILTATLAVLLFNGCSKTPSASHKAVLDSSLPIVSINGTLVDMNAIAFEWKPLQHPRVAGIAIYRNHPKKNDSTKLHLIKRIYNKNVTHYVDTDVMPNTQYRYVFTSFNQDGAESHPSKTVKVSTLPLLKSVSFFSSIGNMPRKAKLIWRPHTNPKVVAYEIQRQTLDDPEWEIITTVKGRLNAEYIDEDLKDDKVYKYRIRAITFDHLKSRPSETVQVTTKPLPPTVTGVTATTEAVKQITISWTPSTDKEIDYYNIYRAVSSDGHFRRVKKTRQTSYVDRINKDGVGYYYRISVVDRDGLESQKSHPPTYGSTLGKPKTPKNFKAELINNAVYLSWKRADRRTKSYTLVKTSRSGWLSKSTSHIDNIQKTELTDTNIAPDILYEYQIYAVDANGVKSQPSEAVEISFESK
ncbi:MAG: hypothetical protein DSZ03_03525 [Sulfurimonas sp.]|nr:MAG: hypothetical protein DSZ03_03525 [Sulfurimonas sp.]